MTKKGKIILDNGKVIGVYVGGVKIGYTPIFSLKGVMFSVSLEDGQTGYIRLKIMKEGCMCYRTVNINFKSFYGILHYL